MITMKHNLDAVLKDVQLRTKQLAFVTATSLTKVAQIAQTELKASLPRKFRRTVWVSQGIRIVPADKRGTPIAAKLYSKDSEKFMWRQEFGAIKTGLGGGKFAGSGKQRIALPGRMQRTASGSIPTRLLPANLGKWSKSNPSGAFVAKSKYGGEVLVSRPKGASKLVFWYTLRKATYIKKRLGLREVGHRTLKTKFPGIFATEMQKALQGRQR